MEKGFQEASVVLEENQLKPTSKEQIPSKQKHEKFPESRLRKITSLV